MTSARVSASLSRYRSFSVHAACSQGEVRKHATFHGRRACAKALALSTELQAKGYSAWVAVEPPRS